MTTCEVAEQMRIGIVVRALPVQRLGGLEYHAMDMAIAMARRGHTIHILSTIGSSGQEFQKDVSITVDEIYGTSRGDYSFGFFRKCQNAIMDFCNQYHPDVLIIIDLAGLFFNPTCVDMPVVGLIHGTMTSEVPLDWRYLRNLSAFDKLKTLWKYKARIALLPAFRRMIKRYRHVIVDSDFTRRELILNNCHEQDELETGQKIHVVPLGIDTLRYPSSKLGQSSYQNGEQLKIAMLGRLQKIKGIEQAIYAAEGLIARGVDFEINIAGTGDFRDEANRLITQLNLGDRVNLVGRVEPEKIGEFLSSHHLFLFPDLTQPAFGLVAVEAMYYGLPVIGSYAGAIPEVVTDDCGWLYDPWKPQELAGLIHSISNRPEELFARSRAAGVCSERFTAGMMGARMEKILLEILAR